MDGLDTTDRFEQTTTGEQTSFTHLLSRYIVELPLMAYFTSSEQSPSLLTIVLDTNPAAWALLSDTLPLSAVVANLLVFINAHLACNYTNKVAVIASHPDKAQWLYPPTQFSTPPSSFILPSTTISGAYDIDIRAYPTQTFPVEDTFFPLSNSNLTCPPSIHRNSYPS